MTTNTIERVTPRRRRTLIGSTIVAAVSVLSLGLGATAASAGTAGTLSQGHVDTGFVAVDPSASKLLLSTNVDENPTPGVANRYYTRSEVNATSSHTTPAYDFEVKSAAKTGSVWIIPDNLPAANSKGILFAGFAGAAEDKFSGSTIIARSVFDLPGFSTSSHITYNIVVDSGSDGTVGLDFSTAIANGQDVTSTGSGTTVNPYQVTFGLGAADDEEAFHIHPKWTFSASGDYWLKVIASTDASGVAASDATYYHIHVDA